MSLIATLSVLALVILSASSESAAQRNLLANGGFEGGDGGINGKQPGVGRSWETICGGPHPEIYSLDRDVKHSGRFSQRMTSTGYNVRFTEDGVYCYHLEGAKEIRHPVGGIKLGNQAIAQTTRKGAVVSGRDYSCGAWVKIEGLTGSWEWFRLGVYWLDAYGKFIGESREPEANKHNYGNHDWKWIRFTARAPEKAAFAKVYLHHHFEHGTVWYDDVWLCEAGR